MNEEDSVNIPAPDEAPNERAAAPTLIERDFEAYNRWRDTGEEQAEPEAQETDTPAAGSQELAETAADSEPVEDQEGEEDGTPDPIEPKKKGGFQKKIEKLTAEKEELAKRLTALENLAKPAEDAPAAAAAEPAADPARPLPEQFDTYEEYVDKLADYKLDQREAKKAQAAQAAQADTHAAAIGKAWQDRQTAAREVYADFDEVTQSEIPVSDAMSAVLLESEDGAHLAYWLGSHPDEAARISKLHPLAAAREMGKIEKGLVKPSKTSTAPAASRAPKPVTPVASRGGSPATKAAGVYDEKTGNDFTAWLAARNAQLGKKAA